jgi:hypothetical protein
MDLHCLLAPRVRQTIQFPLPAPDLREREDFCSGSAHNKAPYAAGTCSAGENLIYRVNTQSQSSIVGPRKARADIRFNVC